MEFIDILSKFAHVVIDVTHFAILSHSLDLVSSRRSVDNFDLPVGHQSFGFFFSEMENPALLVDLFAN
jgi:hypothetical protein